MISGPFRGSDAVASGAVTKAVLRGKRYQRIFPDVYLAAGARIDLATRSRAAFLLVEGCGGVLGGYSAAALLGADCASRGAPAEVIAAVPRRRHPGLVVHRGVVAESDRMSIGGCAVTTPARTAWDLARRLDLVEGVVAVDALSHLNHRHLARLGLCRFRPEDLLARRADQPGARGCRGLDRVVELAEPAAESPMETRLRLLLVLSGLPAPAVQYRLCDEGGEPIVRFDLAYPAARLAIEYDGLGHRRREFGADDRFRDGTTGDLGWLTLRFGYDDVMCSGVRTVQLVANQLRRRLPR